MLHKSYHTLNKINLYNSLQINRFKVELIIFIHNKDINNQHVAKIINLVT